MTCPYFDSVYTAVRQDIMTDNNQDEYCIDDPDSTISSLVSFIHMTSDQKPRQ